MFGLTSHPQNPVVKPGWFELMATAVAGGLVLMSSLLIVPLTDNPVSQTKFYLVFVAALLGLGLYLIKSLYTKKLELAGAKFLLPWFLFSLLHLASSFLSTPYPVESLLGWGGLMTGLGFLTVSLTPLLPAKTSHYAGYVVALAAAGLSVSVVAQLAGFGPSVIINAISGLQVPNNLGFNLTGSTLVGLEVCVVALVMGLTTLLTSQVKSKLWLVCLPIIIVGLGVQIWAILPGKPAQLNLPDWKASWSIALDSLREPRAALFGHGPSSYSNLFMQYRPSWMNGTPNWAVQYGQANNWPLTILPTMGLVGLGLWTWFIVALIRFVMKNHRTTQPLAYGVLSIVVILCLTPPNPVLLTLLAVLTAWLARTSTLSSHVVKLEFQSSTQEGNVLSRLLNRAAASSPRFTPFSTVLSTLVVAGLAAVAVLIGRSYLSQFNAYQASIAAGKNDAQGVYNYNLRSVAQNQYLDVNRRRFALTNLLIAAALSNKADATAEDKNQVVALLQQAITEARAAATLDPADTQNWQVLAQIYQNMIASAPDAREWAVQAYVKSIETSPSDPTLRIALGGIFLANNQPQQAVPFFQQAVALKPDLANAHYNLAVALQQSGALAEAKTSYNKVLSLLKPNTDEYTTVTKQLEEVDKALASSKAATSSAKASGNQSITSQNVTQNPQETVNQPGSLPVNAAGTDTMVPPAAPNTVVNTPAPTTKP